MQVKEKCPVFGFFHQHFVNSSQSLRRSLSRLQNGCLTAMSVLTLEIHPEVERPATLNRSMPSTSGATMGNPAFRISTVSQSLDEEHNLHVWEKVHLCSYLRVKPAHLVWHLPFSVHNLRNLQNHSNLPVT